MNKYLVFALFCAFFLWFGYTNGFNEGVQRGSYNEGYQAGIEDMKGCYNLRGELCDLSEQPTPYP